MPYRSRSDQTRGVTRTRYNALTFVPDINDNILDGIPLPRTSSAVRWIKENKVHEALRITENGLTTSPFLSTQVIAVRDEVRNISFIATQETDGLYLSKIKDVRILERTKIATKPAHRYSLCLRKYDGVVLILYVIDKELFLNDKRISTSCSSPDFPTISIDQPQIGHFAPSKPTAGAISYKCRESGKLIVRLLSPMSLDIGEEITLPQERLLGGADINCFDSRRRARVDCIQGSKLIPSLASLDLSDPKPPSSYEALDLGEVPHERALPATAPSFIDYTGNFHVPVAVKGETAILLDLMPDEKLAVAAIEVSDMQISRLDVFPSKPGRYADFRDGFGDGETDGMELSPLHPQMVICTHQTRRLEV